MAKKKTVGPLDEYYKIIDREIMLCNTPDELAAYAAAMVSSAMTIMVTVSGPEKAKLCMKIALEDLNEHYPPGAQYDKRISPPNKGSTAKTRDKPNKSGNL